MQHKLLALLFCVVIGIVAVHGQSQIRFMNARFYPGQTVDFTTNLYDTNSTNTALTSRYTTPNPVFPASNYIWLPTNSITLNTNLNFYVYDKDDTNVPVWPYVSTNATLQAFQSYSLIYVDHTDIYTTSGPFADVPPQLLLFSEVSNYPYRTLKIVNVAISTYQNVDLWITTDNGDSWYVPYGGETGFVYFSGNITISAFLPGSNNTFFVSTNSLNTVVYIRGDYGEATQFGYSITTNDVSLPVAPVAEPYAVDAPTSTPISPPRPVSRIRFLNAFAYDTSLFKLTIYDIYGNPRYNVSTYSWSDYINVYEGLNNYLTLEVRDQWENSYAANGFYVQAGVNYTVYFNSNYQLNMIRDTPQNYNPEGTYLRIVNNVPGLSYIELNLDGYSGWYSNNGDILYENFLEVNSTYGVIYVYGNQSNSEGFFLNEGTATTIYLVAGSYYLGIYIDQQMLPGPVGPVCVNGYVESNGECNCYSGYSTDNSSPYKCNIAAPYYCFRNQSDALSNDVVPYIPYWNTQVYGNQLYFAVYSDMVDGRRTLIELPNPQCNYVNSPQYYQKYNDGCQDRIDVNIPFTECGFVKTSTSNEDYYKGTVHVKQIDRVTVAGTTYDRVIDTPMPISIRMPKTLAVESYVQVFGPPSLAIDAAFIGQTVSTESQSGNLQYVSAVQYPLQIDTVQLVDLPYGVNAWIEVVNVNCSGVGPCVQRLEVHVSTSSCSISGTYRMVVSLSCRTEQGCPDEAKNGTQVYIESRIVSQSLCGEMSVDIDLSGYIQAYTDSSFSNSALAFYPGQSAYFLISAFSSRVSLSSVSVESVYYYGPNVNYQYLSYNQSLSNIALANNFATGTRGSSQAWFSLDVSVSTPNSGDNSTLFKLYQGQNGVYNFVAIVDVEWFVANNAPTTAPYTNQAPYNQAPFAQTAPTTSSTPFAYPPSTTPFSFKKRMVLQGSVANQGSQFAAQVQVAGPTPSSVQPPQQQQQTPVAANPGTTTDDKPVSSSQSSSFSLVVAVVVALVALF